MEAIKQNKLTEAKVREMVSPLFYTRMRLGEFDPPEMNPYSKLSSADVDTPDHKALAVEAAMKSFVLLKNNGILPLAKTLYSSIGVKCYILHWSVAPSSLVISRTSSSGSSSNTGTNRLVAAAAAVVMLITYLFCLVNPLVSENI